MFYNPGMKWILANAKNFPFTSKRWIRLPYDMHLGFIGGYPNILRDPTPNPYLMQDDLKPGFYFKEFVH